MRVIFDCCVIFVSVIFVSVIFVYVTIHCVTIHCVTIHCVKIHCVKIHWSIDCVIFNSNQALVFSSSTSLQSTLLDTCCNGSSHSSNDPCQRQRQRQRYEYTTLDYTRLHYISVLDHSHVQKESDENNTFLGIALVLYSNSRTTIYR